MLPDQPDYTVAESSFFHVHEALPTLHEVRHQAQLRPGPKKSIAVFPDLKLLVKFGPNVKIAEALNLQAIRQILGDDVPTPELYGWRSDGPLVYIYMQLIPGVTLESRWDTLTDEDRAYACSQLRDMLRQIRTARQDGSKAFISITLQMSQPDAANLSE